MCCRSLKVPQAGTGLAEEGESDSQVAGERTSQVKVNHGRRGRPLTIGLLARIGGRIKHAFGESSPHPKVIYTDIRICSLVGRMLSKYA